MGKYTVDVSMKTETRPRKLRPAEQISPWLVDLLCWCQGDTSWPSEGTKNTVSTTATAVCLRTITSCEGADLVVGFLDLFLGRCARYAKDLIEVLLAASWGTCVKGQ